MNFAHGTRLGPYEIVGLLGAGGMGEVYRARDTRLDRTVAVKVLPAALASDAQLRDRFEREARAISSLNHPHICALFDVGHQDGVDFLVLEYLEGETLAERLANGAGGGAATSAVPAKDALKIAIEISDALDKAHRTGIVHRDLKPANVMLTKAGAKLLDFGLAKSAAPVIAASGFSTLPTTPPNLTAQGTILGTFQYMAPEQIEGLEADARTDIFAFGALLFEMITGRTAFEGKTRASLLGAILKDDPPPVSRVHPVAPAALDRIVATCLAKDPDDRYQSARDLWRDLTWVASGGSELTAAGAQTPPERSRRLTWLVAALSFTALLAMAAVTWRRTGEVTPPPDAVQFTIAAPANASFGGPRLGGTGLATQVAVSPDGRHIVFVAGTHPAFQIWLRPMAGQTATPIPGTEGGTFPFWSPDSRSIAFFANGKLKKVQLAGGLPTVLCDAPVGRGGSWSRDNVIVFAPTTLTGGDAQIVDGGGGLMRVSSAGGAPSVVTTLDPATGETSHRWPHFLPDGRHFIYTASTGPCCPAPKPSTIKIGSLDSAETATLFQTESSVSYASGHLFFAREDTLMAQAFDPVTRKLTGDAFPLAEHISLEGSRYVGASVSETGTLVYASGGSRTALRLTWFDRSGRIVGTLGDAAPYANLALSPDERRLAVGMGAGNPENIDVWLIDIARNVRSRLTVDLGIDQAPVWSPDGARIAFGANRSAKVSLRQRFIDRPTADESLFEASDTPSRPCNSIRTCTILPSSWSADGRYIAFTLTGSFPRTSDVWILPLSGDQKAFPLLQTEFLESAAAFSPDGRWIAYTTNESGQPNVFVQPFPGSGPKYQVSRDGGSHAAWRADGKELFYLAGDRTLMAVPIDAIGEFSAGGPQALFPTIATTFNLGKVYTSTGDGKRFLINQVPEEAASPSLTVIVNWGATIQK